MNISAWTSVISCIIAVLSIVYAAGKFPEKIRQHEKTIDENRRHQDGKLAEMQRMSKETIGRIHERLDNLSKQTISPDGRPFFITRDECRDNRTAMQEKEADRQRLMCKYFEALDKRMERLEGGIKNLSV